MNKNQKIDMNKKDEQKNTRRRFLKKAIYSTPGLIVLGQLAKPTNALASDTTNGVGDGNGFGGGNEFGG